MVFEGTVVIDDMDGLELSVVATDPDRSVGLGAVAAGCCRGSSLVSTIKDIAMTPDMETAAAAELRFGFLGRGRSRMDG